MKCVSPVFWEKAEGQVGGVVLERGLHHVAVGIQRGAEGVSAECVGVIVEGAAADVRRAGSDLDQIAAVGPGGHLVDAEVVLGGEGVVLRRAGEEIARHADARSLGHVAVSAGIVLGHEGDLVEQRGRKGGVQVDHSVVFAVHVVVAGRGQRLAAHALILSVPVLIAVLRVGGVPAAVTGARRAG
jgi:hypothetical protein